MGRRQARRRERGVLTFSHRFNLVDSNADVQTSGRLAQAALFPVRLRARRLNVLLVHGWRLSPPFELSLVCGARNAA